MTIHFGYERSQVINALRFHFLSRRETRLMIVLVNVFALMSIILFYTRKIVPVAFLVGSVVWFVLMVAFWVLMPWLVYKRNDTFRDRFTMNFTHEGFDIGNDIGRRGWKWSQLSEFRESPRFFYFYFSRNSFFLIPKAAFGSDDEVYEARKLFREKTTTVKA